MNTVISVKVDKKVKESAQSVARSAGLTLSAVINAYLRQLVATRRIEIYSPEEMSPHLEGLISQAECELKANQVSQSFSNPDEFIADLNR
jgi:addiction module RelB/DinJ family antitoxin